MSAPRQWRTCSKTDQHEAFMDPKEDSHDEEQWAPLMSNLNDDAPPPDAAFLNRLRAQSTEAILSSSHEPIQLSTRTRWMSSSAIRTLIIALAAAILLIISLTSRFTTLVLAI